MKFCFLSLLLILVVFVTIKRTNAQGCSDAGFCTINAFKPNVDDFSAENKNTFKTGLAVGSADQSVSIFANYLEYRRIISPQFSLETKITSISQKGNGISNFGMSDVFLQGNYSVQDKFKFTLGTKIPLMDGNQKQNGLPLPMHYQSSLGTFDVLLGFGVLVKKLQLVAAIQHPLTQNKNEFISENYPENSPLRKFQSTNNYKRSGDVLLRLSFPVLLGDKLRFTPSLLPIYHLANDKFTTAGGIEEEIIGSKGLTLNGNVYLDFNINEKNTLQLNIGMPFISRDSRPDGLTRSFMANLEYSFKF